MPNTKQESCAEEYQRVILFAVAYHPHRIPVIYFANILFQGFSEYMKEFRDPKRRQRNPDEEPFAGMGTPNLGIHSPIARLLAA